MKTILITLLLLAAVAADKQGTDVLTILDTGNHVLGVSQQITNIVINVPLAYRVEVKKDKDRQIVSFRPKAVNER